MIQDSRFKILERGFTLIEAITAVSVFAIAATSMVGVYTSVQRLNQQSASLQLLQQNGRFITEDITKIIRNGQIDYARYGSSIPQPSPPDPDYLYLLDKDNVQISIYQSGDDLIINKTGIGSTKFSGKEVKVLNYEVFIYPATNPFPGGTEQPAVTIFLDLESTINPRNKIRLPFQITVSTRQYPQ